VPKYFDFLTMSAVEETEDKKLREQDFYKDIQFGSKEHKAAFKKKIQGIKAVLQLIQIGVLDKDKVRSDPSVQGIDEKTFEDFWAYMQL